MARLDEIAEGVAAMLANSAEPEPLSVTFWGQSPAEMAFLVRSVVAAAERSGRPVCKAAVSSAVAHLLQNDPEEEWQLPLSADVADNATVSFWRLSPT